jgi:OOP family OmpA-OmpF porin
LRIEVQGHTDAVGSAPFNLKLSQARAESVREYLVTHGVPAEELSAKGYGKTQPIADNKTAAGRAQNRRVVMSVLENPGDVEVKQGEGAR